MRLVQLVREDDGWTRPRLAPAVVTFLVCLAVVVLGVVVLYV